MAVVQIRADPADQDRAWVLTDALTAETISAEPAPRTGAASITLFVWSAASATPSFHEEVRRAATERTSLVAAFGGDPGLGPFEQSARFFDLDGWDGRDRSFSEFRNLVRTCMRLLGVSLKGQTLSVAALGERRLMEAAEAVHEPQVRSRSLAALERIREEAELFLIRRPRDDATAATTTPSEPARRPWEDNPREAAGAERLIRAEQEAHRTALQEEERRRFEESEREEAEQQRLNEESERQVKREIAEHDAERLGSVRPRPMAIPSAMPRRYEDADPDDEPVPFRKKSLVQFATAVALLGAAWYFGRGEIAALSAGILKFFGAATPPIPPAPKPDNEPNPPTDLADVSAFAPRSGHAGDTVLVQIYLHAFKDARAAARMAREADPSARRRGVATLASEIARGERVDIVLDAPGLAIDEPAQHLVWHGRARACQFSLYIPADAAGRTCHVKAHVLVGRIPVGSLRFTLGVSAADAVVSDRPELPEQEPHRYRRAFLSYATPDRAEVLKRAQALRAAKIDFFQDLLQLEPGQRWEYELYKEIDACDLFLLFWSSHAAKSEWVLREAQRAMDQRKDITPVILEGPPVPLPPAPLQHIHFNDPLCYAIAAIANERRVN